MLVNGDIQGQQGACRKHAERPNPGCKLCKYMQPPAPSHLDQHVQQGILHTDLWSHSADAALLWRQQEADL